jgi:FtsP/CotA-like multicopper oxidase with cupredoxin domain
VFSGVPKLRITLAAGILLGLATGCNGIGSALAPAPKALSDTNDLPQPPVVASVGGVAQVTLTAALDPATGAPGVEYAGQFVAPTIEVKPGDTIDITYKNALPPSTTPTNMTDLHFHGLTTTPNAPGDDVISMMAMPGQQLHYVVPVPTTEEPGVYWYHSHAHPQSNWQVTSGLAGAIIVDGIEQHYPALASLRQQLIILRDPQNTADYANLVGPAPSGSSSYNPCRAETGSHLTVNGLTEARIGIQAGEKQLFRVVNMSANRYVDLAVDGQYLTLFSLDGFPLDSYPGSPGTASVPDVLIPPAGRAEFTVVGNASGALMRTKCVDTGPDGDAAPDAVLASLSPQGASSTLSSLARLPAYKASAKRAAVPLLSQAIPAPVAQRTVVFSEVKSSGQYYLNGAQYDPAGPPVFTAHAGTTEEWTVANASSELHAFHIHQIHFSVESINGVAQSPGRWVDTVNVPYTKVVGGRPQVGVVKLLMDFRNPIIRGTFVFHCHLLKHEDGGMMAKIQVL